MLFMEKCGKLYLNYPQIHSLPTADSSRAVVSYSRKNGHLVLANHSGSLPMNSVDMLIDIA